MERDDRYRHRGIPLRNPRSLGRRSAADRPDFTASGCHADRAIALARALTEAAQTRLTYIAGIRDDLAPAEYEERRTTRSATPCSMRWRARSRPSRSPTCRTLPPTISAEDLRWALGRLRAVGIDRVIAVDLTPAGSADPGRAAGDPRARMGPASPELPAGASGTRGSRSMRAVIFAGPSLPPGCAARSRAGYRLAAAGPAGRSSTGRRSAGRRSSASSTAISR